MVIGNNNMGKMKKVNLYIMALTAVCTLFTACQDEDIVQPEVTPAAVGDEIIFGGRAGFENSNPGSRTVYSNEVYTYNKVDYERIDWIEGDKIEIYSPQAVNGPTSHYEITGFKTGDESINDGTNKGEDYAVLTRIGDSSLQWGEGYIKEDKSGYHDFYAMYPSSMMFTDDPTKTVETGVYMDGTTVTGIVPIVQNPIEFTGTTDVVAKPNMDYAYMVAKSTANRIEGSVGLSFVPIVTAVEVQLKLTDTPPTGATGVTPVNIAEVKVEGQGIAGSFTADLSNWTNTYPTCTNADDATDVINISAWQKAADGTLTPTKVLAGGSFTFTVFLLPGADVENLKVSISETGADFVGKTLQNITIQKNKKNIYQNLMLPPSGIAIDASKWMSQLDPQTNLSRLSIPGTANSFSNLTSDDYYKAQLISFADQWKAGIRAFEITCSRPSSASTTLGGVSVLCNGSTVYEASDDALTVKEVFDMILDTDDDDNDEDGIIGPNSSETAMVILTYQPSSGLNDNRVPSTFMGALNVLFDELNVAYPPVNGKSRFVLYSPTLTLEDARGSIMIVARPTQLDEDDSEVRSAALTAVGTKPILVVDGCGTGKDKWGRRGYRVDGTLAADIKNAATGAPVFENYFTTSTTGWRAEDPASQTYPDWTTEKITKDTKGSYAYETNNSFNIWFQEWARVVEKDAKVNAGSGTTIIVTYFYYANWWESYKEKLEAVKSTFDMAIGDTYKDQYVFINSLSGYLMDETNEDSRTPYMTRSGIDIDAGGECGRIGDLAKKLNGDFYSYILTAGMNTKTGPTGVILMDRVSNTLTTGDEGSYYLPGVVIANNFKYGSGTNLEEEKDPNEGTGEETEG